MLCEEISAAKALEWGLGNQVELDAAVDAMCATLIDKLPECIRYTKQQLNFRRDETRHQTIGLALGRVSLHNPSPEVRKDISTFVEKREIEYTRAGE